MCWPLPERRHSLLIRFKYSGGSPGTKAARNISADLTYAGTVSSPPAPQMVGDRFELREVNEAGRYPIPELGVELGIWNGQYLNLDLPWMRWWDLQGQLLPSGSESFRLQRAS